MAYYCYLRNVKDLMPDGKTSYERRFGEPFHGPVIPFGAMVENHPISARDQLRLHQFGKTVLPGILLGYALIVVWIWKGDILVADVGELENLGASEIDARRHKCKGSVNAKKGWIFFYFPVADGSAKLFERDHGVRESTLKRDQPVRSADLLEDFTEIRKCLNQQMNKR